MSRIVAFGCSHTYGLELEDCPTINDPPSKLAYPSILATSLGFDLLNNADTGSSQRQICATVLNNTFDVDDIVIINWTSPSRRGMWSGSYWQQLGPWTDDKIWQKYYDKYGSVDDDMLDSAMHINLANFFLQGKCKRIINTSHDHYGSIINNTLSWNLVKIELIFRDNNFYYNQLQGGHPDARSHEVFAERLMKII